MTALKKSLDRALSGVEFRPELKRQVLEAARPEGREDVKMRRKMSAALIFALIAALILAGVAVAAVVTRGFGWYATQIDDPAWQYNMNELEKRATVAEAERTPAGQAGQGSGPRFEVTQAYYDGSRIDVAYTLTASDHYSDASWRPTADELKLMEFYETVGVQGFEDPASNLQMASDFESQGVCGVHIHSYRVGDHMKVAGLRYTGWEPFDREWTDGITGGYQILEQLPKEARNQDSVELTFDLTEYDLYCYQTQQGYYYRVVDKESVPLEPVVIPRGKGETVTVKASSAFDSYRMIAQASVSPVEIEVLICQVLPDAWVVKEPFDRAEELKGVDYIKNYRLLADGTALKASLTGEGNSPGRLENELPKAFQKADPKKLYTLEIEAQGVPEGTKELRLRPVYSISGERPAEDVVLEIPQ